MTLIMQFWQFLPLLWLVQFYISNNEKEYSGWLFLNEYLSDIINPYIYDYIQKKGYHGYYIYDEMYIEPSKE